MATNRKLARKVTITSPSADTPEKPLIKFGYGLDYSQADFHSASPVAKVLNALSETINSIKKP